MKYPFQLANPEGSWVRRFQDWWQRWLLVIPPIFMNGRGMFQYTAGSMPHRRPITVVVGAPVKVGRDQEFRVELKINSVEIIIHIISEVRFLEMNL